MRASVLRAALTAAALWLGMGMTEGRADLFVSNFDDGTISRVTSAGTVTTFATGFTSPTGLAFDASGNLFVADGTGTISKVAPDGTVDSTPFASGLSSPAALAFGDDGNLYVANYNAFQVDKITPDGTRTNFSAGFNQPVGLAFDADGNLFVSTDADGTVIKVAPDGTYGAVPFASGFSTPYGLAFDSSGDLYVANSSAGTISKVASDGTVDPTPFASGLMNPNGLAFDSSGDLYVANTEADSISRVSPTGDVSPFVSGLAAPTFLAFGPTAAVPEPSQLVLLGGVAVVAAGYAWRRRPA